MWWRIMNLEWKSGSQVDIVFLKSELKELIVQNCDKLQQQYTYMQKPDMYMHTHWYSKVEGVAYGV